MPILTFAKSALGAIVSVSLLPSTRQLITPASGAKTPIPERFKMLIDSGAENTSVCASKIASWGLNRASFHLSQSTGGVTPVDAYDLALTILDANGNPFWKVDPLLVTERANTPFAGMPYAGLIGRDVLDSGLFVYDGKASHCTLAF